MTESEKYMTEALAEAEKALAAGEVPIGAVMVRNGEIIARGHNLRNTDKNPLRHAEIDVIDAAAKIVGDWRLEDCVLYVTVEPCPMCAGACVMSRLKRVVYAVSDPKMGFLGGAMKFHDLPTLNHSLIVNSGVLEEDCARLLKTFFSLKRAISKSAKSSSSQSGAE